MSHAAESRHAQVWELTNMLAKHFRSEAPENLMRMAGTDLKLKKKAEDDKGESKVARKIRHKYIQVIIH